MPIGDATISRAIQTNQQLNEQNIMNIDTRRSRRVNEALASEGLEETKRSNLIREGLASEGLKDTQRRTALAEKSQESTQGFQARSADMTEAQFQLQKDEMYLGQKPQWDKIADTYYAGVQDFDEQQAELLSQKTDMAKGLRVTGMSTIQAASAPEVQKIELELERLEKSRQAFISGFEENDASMRALMMSSTGYEAGILGQASPFTLSKMSDEDAQAYQNTTKDQYAQYKKQREEQEAYEGDLQARMLEKTAKAKSKGAAEGAYETESQLQAEKFGYTTAAAEQKAVGKAMQEGYENDVKATVGTIENTVRSLGKQINNLLPSSSGEYSLLGGTEGSFKSTAEAYYANRPDEFHYDLYLWNQFMGDLAENHENEKWMKSEFQSRVDSLRTGENSLSQSDIPNPLLPIADALSVLSSDARFWKADAGKLIGKVALTYRKGQEKKVKPEPTSLQP